MTAIPEDGVDGWAKSFMINVVTRRDIVLNFQDFFTACVGHWTIERTYHTLPQGDVERSHTEYQVMPLDHLKKQAILSCSEMSGVLLQDQVSLQDLPGFAIAFDTISEKGETLSMQLQAMFVPDRCLQAQALQAVTRLSPPVTTRANLPEGEERIAGFYLRDQGYSEAGAIAGRFTYQPSCHTLEMITYYRQSVAVDQMHLVAADLRLRTIVTYQRPTDLQTPTEITLVGFGVERKMAIA